MGIWWEYHEKIENIMEVSCIPQEIWEYHDVPKSKTCIYSWIPLVWEYHRHHMPNPYLPGIFRIGMWPHLLTDWWTSHCMVQVWAWTCHGICDEFKNRLVLIWLLTFSASKSFGLVQCRVYLSAAYQNPPSYGTFQPTISTNFIWHMDGRHAISWWWFPIQMHPSMEKPF